MHRQLIRQLDDAVAEIFALMLNLACASEPSSPGDGSHPPPETGLTAIVQFSASMQGICVVQLTQCAASEIAANLMGIPPEEVPFDLCADVAGELCNMIAGSWKSRQSGPRAACKISCPIVTVEPLVPPTLGCAEAATVSYCFARHKLIVCLTCN